MRVETTSADSELGCWRVARWTPTPAEGLYPFVASIWAWNGYAALPFERVFPDGTFSLIIQLDAPYAEAGAPAPYSAICLDGLRSRALVIAAPRTRTRVVGLQLRAPGFLVLAPGCATELRDRSVDAVEVVGAAAELAARCDAARGEAARVQAAAAWLHARVERGRRFASAVGWMLAEIERHDGNVGIAALEHGVALAPARLAAAFRAHVGVTPKRYARIVRFRRALALVDAGAPLAGAATDAGYYDQAHFTAEFRAHAGLTPLAYARATRFPGSASLAEDFFQDARDVRR